MNLSCVHLKKKGIDGKKTPTNIYSEITKKSNPVFRNFQAGKFYQTLKEEKTPSLHNLFQKIEEV